MYQRTFRAGNRAWGALLLWNKQRNFNWVSTQRIRQQRPLLSQPTITVDQRLHWTNSRKGTVTPDINVPVLTYSPIGAGLIRTVTLHRGESSEPIRCSLTEVSLAKPPQYEALSYEWGSKADPGTIFLNNQDFQVTKNLEEALKTLRWLTSDRTLWVDALCINQEDISERDAQIQQMPRIYSTADRVLLRLGVAGEGSDFVMEMLLEAEAQKFNSHIMEEIAYAKDVLLLCGLYQIAYSSLLKFLDILNTSGLSIIARIVARDKEPRYMLYPSSNSGPNSLLRPGWLQTQDHLPVDQLLCKFSSKACSDPRDKIFGFWGLFSPEMQHLVPVDYSKSIPEVYRSTTEAIIKTTRRMDVICWPRYKSTTQIVEPGSWESDLPSWTPNWNRRHIGVSLALHPLHQHFNACSSHSAFYRFLDNGRTLQTRGICLGNILHMQQRTVIDHNRSFPLDPDLNLLWSYVNSCRDYLKASFDSIEGDALLSTLSAGLFYSILDIDSTTRINIHRFFTSTRGYLSNTFGNDSFRVYDILLYYMYGILSGRELFSFSSKKDQERLQGYAISKAIPTLKIGLAPNNAQEGDKVCVLVGNKTPVILRQQGNHHIILGDAYVHGFMHGEAMINVDVGLEQLAEFFIH